MSDGESRQIHQQSLRTWHPESEGHFCEEGRDGDSHRPGGLYSTSSLREVCTASEKDRLASYCANCRVYHLASEGRCPRAIEAKRKIAYKKTANDREGLKRPRRYYSSLSSTSVKMKVLNNRPKKKEGHRHYHVLR